MTVPQFSPFIGQEEYDALEECFTANWITEGPKADEFIRQLKSLLKAEYAVLAPNGTLALYLALRGLGIERGDEVIVPDFTFIAAANAVEMAGAIPIFVDVEEGTLQMDVSRCEPLITPKTVAIMPVSIFGATPNYEKVLGFAAKHNLQVIEDACEALGVTYHGKHAGTFGDAGCFSFFADKTITTGEGGLVVTNRKDVYDQMLLLRNQGRRDRGSFVHPEIGYNFRLTDLQCAIGLAQLRKLDVIIKRKQSVAEHYATRLSGISEVQLTTVEPGSSYIPFRVTVFAERAHELMEFLQSRGVQPRSFFLPLHKQPCYQHLRNYPHPALLLEDSSFPVSTDAYNRGICLPTFAAITPGQINHVCNVIEQFYR